MEIRNYILFALIFGGMVFFATYFFQINGNVINSIEENLKNEVNFSEQDCFYFCANYNLTDLNCTENLEIINLIKKCECEKSP